jgi:hypothetical protein
MKPTSELEHEVSLLGRHLKELAADASRTREQLFPLICELHRSGRSLGTIASLAGLTRGRVHQIVHEPNGARPA